MQPNLLPGSYFICSLWFVNKLSNQSLYTEWRYAFIHLLRWSRIFTLVRAILLVFDTYKSWHLYLAAHHLDCSHTLPGLVWFLWNYLKRHLYCVLILKNVFSIFFFVKYARVRSMFPAEVLIFKFFMYHRQIWLLIVYWGARKNGF